jgi:transcriptional regulator of acetoin/glycerol metabolism
MTQVQDLNLDGLEREAIREAMRRCDGNKVHAAKLLGMSRTSLRRRMRNHGLDL